MHEITDDAYRLARMTAYLKRLVASLAAYQIADLISKFIAVLLLPVYTRYIPPAGYGVVELLANGVIFISILVRLGIIEAFLRYYFVDDDQVRRDALVRRAVSFLLIATTIGSAALVAASEPLSRLVLGYGDQTTFLIAVLGLWAFTNLELAYGVLRVDERLRAYAIASVSNVLLTIVASVVLVVGLGEGARGLLLGNYGVSTLVLFALWWTMRERLRPQRSGLHAPRPGAERLRQLLRFGLPTVPAEASVYALSIIDRYYVYHDRSPSLAGLYSIAIKLAGAVAFIVRAFQYAWPPLAYSVSDDAEAGRLYGLVTTYYLLVSGWVVAGLTLLGRWVLRLLTSPAYYGAHTALPWVSLGWALYGLWVVFLVIAGRAKVTTRNFPAALAGLAANVVLLVTLVPPLGIAGAGIALCGAYVVMLVVMHSLTRRAFRVAFEWRRLAHLTLVMAGLAVAGNLLLPTHGVVGFLTRASVFILMPVVLLATGFAHRQELGQARALLGRVRRLSPTPAGSES
ncbi:MAG: oligosaccharide flippase family protein [Solirubrobacterales bacterium]|nr:oligosaccharide flippase family protein [Solirubrobacterales bacterium]